MDSFKFAKDPAVKRNRRINIFLVGFAVLFFIVIMRLTIIQVLDAEKYKIAAKKQYETKVLLYPSRGLIFDRNMNLLVSNSYRVSLAVDPNMVEKPEKLADILAQKFGKDRSEYLEKIQATNTSFVYLERKVNPEDVGGLDTLDVPGLIVMNEPTRVYNYGYLASQILGFTNNENRGQMGLEMALNKELAGTEGFMIMQRDGRGNTRPATDFPRKEPVKGHNVVLTLDINIQRIVEEELAAGVRTFNADGGKVIVMSTQTGEVLGMSSYPTFDPNDISVMDTVGMKNKVISDVFEPGSTFKLITAAGSLEENVENRNSIIQTEGGSFEVNGLKVKDSHGADNMTFQQTIEQSSNIGMMKIARNLGSEKLYKYARDFGIGIYTGIELPGENRGYLKRPIDFSGESLEYISIGYQVLINTMQLAVAYSSVANYGMMMKPYIIKKELSLNGQTLYENKPTQVRQVISQKTAKILTELLTGVVDRGTGKSAQVEGMNVAGKTGTSQMLVNGKYSSASHTSSFIGYFPSEDPVILVAVVIDNPKAGEYYGGTVSAPIFQNISSRIISYKGVSDYSSAQLINANYEKLTENEGMLTNVMENYVFVPNLKSLRVQDAVEILNEKGLKFQVVGEDVKVKPGAGYELFVAGQEPAPNTKLTIGNDGTVKLYVKAGEIRKDKIVKVPDIRKMSLRKAINTLVASGFDVEISGSGGVVGQSPEPGAEQLPDSKVLIYCKNE